MNGFEIVSKIGRNLTFSSIQWNFISNIFFSETDGIDD